MEWKDKIDSFKKIDVRGIQGWAMSISPNKRELRSSTHTFIVQK